MIYELKLYDILTNLTQLQHEMNLQTFGQWGVFDDNGMLSGM